MQKFKAYCIIDARNRSLNFYFKSHGIATSMDEAMFYTSHSVFYLLSATIAFAAIEQFVTMQT